MVAFLRGSAIVFVVVVVAATATGGVVAAEEADTAAETTTLTVTIVDNNGNPISDADLTATWEGGSDGATTAGNGKAFLDVAETGEVTIRMDHPNYIRNHPYVIENVTEDEVTIETALKGRAVVTVEDDDGPVPNAVVRLFKNGPVVNERTGADGQLSTEPIERGEYTLVVFKEEYLRNSTTVDVGARTETTMEIETGSVLVSLGVTDDHFDPPRPLPNASVTVEGIGTVSTLGNGEATISVPVNREFTVRVTKDEYRTASRSLSVRESPESVNLTVRRTPAVSVQAANERIVVNETVRVTVTDEYDDPLPGTTVRLDGSSVGETDDSGAIDVPIDSPGEHTISVDTGNLEDSVTVVGIQPAPDETPTPTATPTPTPTLTPTTTSGSGPGLGVVTGVVALLALSVLWSRRRR